MISNLHCIIWSVIWKFQIWHYDLIVIDSLYTLRLSDLMTALHFGIFMWRHDVITWYDDDMVW